jgi:hypothetical protein
MKYTELQTLGCCSQTLLHGYSNIYGLNGYKIQTDKDQIFKYIPYKHLLGDITNNRITFVSPRMWEDTLETRYYKLPNYNKLSFNEPDVFCMCLTSKQAENEDAFWHRYAPQNDELLKVHYNIKEFFNLLDKFASNNNLKVYVGEAIYVYKTQVLAITPTKNSLFFPQKFDVEHYLSLMSLKRVAYNYENEIRIFIVSGDSGFNSNVIYQNGDLLQVDYIASACKPHPHIDQIRLSPYPQIQGPFPKPDKIQNINSRRVAIENTFGVPSIKFTKSNLCKKYRKCKL